jgi:hypothetical protein
MPIYSLSLSLSASKNWKTEMRNFSSFDFNFLFWFLIMHIHIKKHIKQKFLNEKLQNDTSVTCMENGFEIDKTRGRTMG